VDPGVILTGHTGDDNGPGVPTTRADWAVDGSFLVFRYLFQQVPEFNKFLEANPVKKDGNGKDLTPEEGSELLGARMVGRWKSGKECHPQSGSHVLTDNDIQVLQLMFLPSWTTLNWPMIPQGRFNDQS